MICSSALARSRSCESRDEVVKAAFFPFGHCVFLQIHDQRATVAATVAKTACQTRNLTPNTNASSHPRSGPRTPAHERSDVYRGGILPIVFASKLAVLLEDHIALRSFYPEIERHYHAVDTGRLIKPRVGGVLGSDRPLSVHPAVPVRQNRVDLSELRVGPLALGADGSSACRDSDRPVRSANWFLAWRCGSSRTGKLPLHLTQAELPDPISSLRHRP